MNMETSERRQKMLVLQGAWLREKRHDRRLLQREVAAAAGVARTSLVHAKNGLHDMRFTTMLDVLDALGCTRDEVFELFEIDAELRHGGVS